MPLGRPTAAHDGVIRVIQDLIEEALEGRLPTMATIQQERDRRGRWRVQLDDEEEPRRDGFVKCKGQTFRRGDRVLVAPTRSGHHVIVSAFAERDDDDRSVGADQLADGAVTMDKIAPEAFSRIGERLANVPVSALAVTPAEIVRAGMAALDPALSRFATTDDLTAAAATVRAQAAAETAAQLATKLNASRVLEGSGAAVPTTEHIFKGRVPSRASDANKLVARQDVGGICLDERVTAKFKGANNDRTMTVQEWIREIARRVEG